MQKRHQRKDTLQHLVQIFKKEDRRDLMCGSIKEGKLVLVIWTQNSAQRSWNRNLVNHEGKAQRVN